MLRGFRGSSASRGAAAWVIVMLRNAQEYSVYPLNPPVALLKIWTRGRHHLGIGQRRRQDGFSSEEQPIQNAAHAQGRDTCRLSPLRQRRSICDLSAVLGVPYRVAGSMVSQNSRGMAHVKCARRGLIWPEEYLPQCQVHETRC